MLQQAEEDHRHWESGNDSNGWGSSQRLKATTEGSSFEVDEGAVRSGGGGGYRGGFVDPLTVSNGNCNGFGGDLTLFSPSDVFSPSPRQPLQQQNSSSSPFSWQSLLGGQASARWQPDAGFPGLRVEQAKSLHDYALGEENVRRGGQNELRVTHKSSVVTEEEADRGKEEWTKNVNSAKENWRKFGGMNHSSCVSFIMKFSISGITLEVYIFLFKLEL